MASPGQDLWRFLFGGPDAFEPVPEKGTYDPKKAEEERKKKDRDQILMVIGGGLIIGYLVFSRKKR